MPIETTPKATMFTNVGNRCWKSNSFFMGDILTAFSLHTLVYEGAGCMNIKYSIFKTFKWYWVDCCFSSMNCPFNQMSLRVQCVFRLSTHLLFFFYFLGMKIEGIEHPEIRCDEMHHQSQKIFESELTIAYHYHFKFASDYNMPFSAIAHKIWRVSTYGFGRPYFEFFFYSLHFISLYWCSATEFWFPNFVWFS